MVKSMKAEYVTPFAEAAVRVLGAVLGGTPERGAPAARPQIFTTQQINIVFGVTGSVEGLVIYGMSMITADKIASKMIGAQVVTFDALAASAIAELGNMISGNSVTIMQNQGFNCDLTPPTIIRGSNVRITTLDIPAICIPFTMEGIGSIDVNVSIQQRASAIRAA